jgi:capsular polysaccharide biosynthesis protein
MRDALSLVGYSENDWVVWDGRRTHINRLIVPTLPRETEGSAPKLTNHYYSLNHDSVRWLSKQMCSNIPEDASSHAPDTGRLFVSRQGIGNRRIVDIERLSPLFDEYGFERFRPEEYPITEQVRTFADANVVLGVHGAGLTNLLFATDATLIELFGKYANPVFYILAIRTGNDYACAEFDSLGRNLDISATRLRELLTRAGIEPIR